MKRQVLHIDRTVLRAYQVQRLKTLELRATFTDEPDSLAKFSDYLADHQNHEFIIVCTDGNENFITQSIPRLPRQEQQRLIARRLEQAFPDATLRMATTAPGQTGRTRAIQFSELIPPPTLPTWLLRMEAAQSALSGIFSFSQAAAALLKTEGCSKGNHLLIACHENECHEVVVINEQIRFARRLSKNILTPETGDVLFAEAEAIFAYLATRNLLAPPGVLKIFLLASSPTHCQELSRTQPPHLEFHSLAPPPNQNQANWPLAALLAHRPQQQYAPPQHLKAFHRQRIASRAQILGTAIFSLCLGLTALNLHRAHIEDASSLRLEQEKTIIGKALQAQLQSIPETPLPPETLLSLQQTLNRLQQKTLRPAKLLRDISLSIEALPQISLHSLAWKSPDPTMSTGEASLEIKGAAPASEKGQVQKQFANLSQRLGGHKANDQIQFSFRGEASDKTLHFQFNNRFQP